MRHTDEEIKRAAERFEELADKLDPETARVVSTEDLRRVAAATQAVREDEARLREAVDVARAHGKACDEDRCRILNARALSRLLGGHPSLLARPLLGSLAPGQVARSGPQVTPVTFLGGYQSAHKVNMRAPVTDLPTDSTTDPVTGESA